MSEITSTKINYTRPNFGLVTLLVRLCFCTAIIYLLYNSLRPDLRVNIDINNIDKIMHFMAYATLCILALIAFPRQKLLIIGLSIIIFSGAIELAQHSMAIGRHGSWLDMLANITGCCTPIAFWVFYKHVKAKIA